MELLLTSNLLWCYCLRQKLGILGFLDLQENKVGVREGKWFFFFLLFNSHSFSIVNYLVLFWSNCTCWNFPCPDINLRSKILNFQFITWTDNSLDFFSFLDCFEKQLNEPHSVLESVSDLCQSLDLLNTNYWC